MKKPTEGRYWRIGGDFDAPMKFRRCVPLASITPNQVRHLLRALASRSLDPDGLIGAYASRGAAIANGLLEVQPDGPSAAYVCGKYAACIVDSRGHIVHQPQAA